MTFQEFDIHELARSQPSNQRRCWLIDSVADRELKIRRKSKLESEAKSQNQRQHCCLTDGFADRELTIKISRQRPSSSRRLPGRFKTSLRHIDKMPDAQETEVNNISTT